MKKPNFFKKLSPKVLVSLLVIGALASLGAVRYTQSKKPAATTTSLPISYSQVKSAKLKSFFNKVQKAPNQKDIYLKEIGPLSVDELNQGYQAAVASFQYDLAIDFYLLGAQDCFQDGEDILLIAINTGRLDLVNELLSPKYALKLYHLNAVRSLVNIDQSNWAYIYKKQDTDDLGFQKYLIQSQKLASEVISLYKLQNPTGPMRYDTTPSHQEDYQSIFGENIQARFEAEVNTTLKGKYTFEEALHGTQHTPILINEEGERIGVIKTKNEILAEALDYDHFAGVPPAITANIPEMGSVVVQKWVPNSQIATEYKREKDWNAEQLHHIRVLDIRLGNSDRNKGNVLIVPTEQKRLVVPIDHDLIMHYIPNDNNWEAAYLNVPFSPISKDYIQKLDLEKDAEIMQNLGYKSDDIVSMKVRTTLLKMAAEHNLTLKETDMLFRFYYYDFLEAGNTLSPQSSESEIRETFNPKMDEVSSIVQNPVQVWGLIGNNYELYI